jgi:hypothetical protein
MPGNIAGNNFSEVLLVLSSHYLEHLQVIQSNTISERLLVLGTLKSHGAKNSE